MLELHTLHNLATTSHAALIVLADIAHWSIILKSTRERHTLFAKTTTLPTTREF